MAGDITCAGTASVPHVPDSCGPEWDISQFSSCMPAADSVYSGVLEVAGPCWISPTLGVRSVCDRIWSLQASRR